MARILQAAPGKFEVKRLRAVEHKNDGRVVSSSSYSASNFSGAAFVSTSAAVCPSEGSCKVPIPQRESPPSAPSASCIWRRGVHNSLCAQRQQFFCACPYDALPQPRDALSKHAQQSVVGRLPPGALQTREASMRYEFLPSFPRHLQAFTASGSQAGPTVAGPTP